MDKEHCTHSFELSRVTLESTAENMIYHQVAYVVCVKCGEVRKSNV